MSVSRNRAMVRAICRRQRRSVDYLHPCQTETALCVLEGYQHWYAGGADGRLVRGQKADRGGSRELVAFAGRGPDVGYTAASHRTVARFRRCNHHPAAGEGTASYDSHRAVARFRRCNYARDGCRRGSQARERQRSLCCGSAREGRDAVKEIWTGPRTPYLYLRSYRGRGRAILVTPVSAPPRAPRARRSPRRSWPSDAWGDEGGRKPCKKKDERAATPLKSRSPVPGRPLGARGGDPEEAHGVGQPPRGFRLRRAVPSPSRLRED